MHKKTKSNLKKRFYSYTFSLKEPEDLVQRIVDDVEIITQDHNNKIHELEGTVRRLRFNLKKVKKE